MVETINRVMERVARTLPNAVDERDQARWLLTLDGRVYEEVTKADAPDRLPCKAWPEDGDRELLAAGPYGAVYDLYLTAMLRFHLGEYSDYNNIAVQFEKTFQDFKAWWRRGHVPAAGPEIKGV